MDDAGSPSSGVVALDEVDTRSLVLHLRERGAMRAAAVSGDVSVAAVLERVRAHPPMAGRNLVADVSTTEIYAVGYGGPRIAVLDYGCKRSIVERLLAAGASVTGPAALDPGRERARRRARRRRALERPRRSVASWRRRSRRCASCSAASRSSASASATSCSP